MIRAVVVDDEEFSRETLAALLREYCEGVEVVAMAASAETARLAIEKFQPDALFLDIEMPNEDGFDLLRSTPNRDFSVIFVTAYDQYAINAIKASATDYLLKPVDIDDLREAVEKLQGLEKKKGGETSGNYQEQLQAVLENMRSASRKLTRISLPYSNGMRLVNLADVIRCESDNNYTTFFLRTKEKILVTKSIKEYEELLADSNFLRVHKSHLVNMEHVERFIRDDGGYVKMSDGTSIEVSRRKKDELIERLQQISA